MLGCVGRPVLWAKLMCRFLKYAVQKEAGALKYYMTVIPIFHEEVFVNGIVRLAWASGDSS